MPMTANTTSISNLFSDSTVYVIPTFQRPYAWEDTQWDELLEDVRNATTKTTPYHYFAPLHIVPVGSPTSGLWRDYTDLEVEDIKELNSNGFLDSKFRQLNVFLVIDGQQRLITFYSLLHHYTPSFVTLKSGFTIPNVILGNQDDQVVFRNLLGLHSPAPSVSHTSRAQTRLASLFNKLGPLTSSDPCYSTRNTCHLFLNSAGCETLRVELNGTVRLAAFMTLNDRGKPLSNLEKVKSLFMEIDDNSPTAPKPVVINNVFGTVYQSLEAADAYIDDDEFLRQLGMNLWEGASLASILSTTWPPVVSGKNRSNYIHQIGADTLYDEYFKKLPSAIAWNFLHGDIVSAVQCVTDSHNKLVPLLGQAKSGALLLGQPSFVNALGFGLRDAIEDYHSVLISLGLQSKQIGFLLSTHQLFPSLDWHHVLGSYLLDNRLIKSELSQVLAQIILLNQSIKRINIFGDKIREEINSIPDYVNREYTALQVAETLRLIVGNSKPGGYSGAWNGTFRGSKSTSSQNFLNDWLNYAFTFDSRDKFIMNIAKSTQADNKSAWVKYLLNEYEYCVSGCNAHRNAKFEIEHFFASAWGASSTSLLGAYSFPSLNEYDSIVDTIGNKLVLDASLNRALGAQDPNTRVNAYRSQSYGSVSVMTSNPSQSAIDIGNELPSSTAQYRVYIQLRSLRLAIFAVKRF